MRQRSQSDLALYQPDSSTKLDDDTAIRRSNSSRSRRKLDKLESSWQAGSPFLSGLLQEHLLQVSAPLLRPVAPLLVEPASSSSEEEVPTPILVATTDHHLLLIGSSNGNTKSAPATPLDDFEGKTVDACDGAGQLQPSPSHAFTKSDRHAIKQLSSSTPAMTHAPIPSRGSSEAALGTRGPGDPSDSPRAPAKSPTAPQLNHLTGSSKARQKKFHRHFKQVAIEERVLNYYSCALVGDILLQGHLYITHNYFAFYSNVFGYVTKLLIPIVDVSRITKEKTAKIIPNAIGISTIDEKHVFGSLMSRDSTFKFMNEVLDRKTGPVEEHIAPKAKQDIEDSASGDMVADYESSASGSANEDRLRPPTSLPVVANAETFQKLLPKVRKGGSISIPVSSKNSSKEYWSVERSTSVLMFSTLLLITLFMSAAFLLYRVVKIQQTFTDFPLVSSSEDIYEEILKWQSTLHARSANEVHEFVNANLNQIAKVRLSLEALSMLIVTNDKPYERSNQPKTNPADGSKVS